MSRKPGATPHRSFLSSTPRSSRTSRRQFSPNLSNIHDPAVNELPFEILSAIFKLYCAPPIQDVRRQVTLLAVCQHWRDVASKNPTLWTVLPVPPISDQQLCVDAVISWFARSEPMPISIEFTTRLPERNTNARARANIQSQIAEVVIVNKARVRRLSTSALPVLQHKMLSGFFTKNECWTMLSHISMDGVLIIEAFQVLRRCPNLSHAAFKSLHGTMTLPPREWSARHLKQLRVSFRIDSNPAAFFIEKNLKTPALQELIFDSDAGGHPLEALTAFLGDSKSSLTTLHIGLVCFTRHDLIPLLESQPSLCTVSIMLRVVGNFVELARTSRAFDGLMKHLLTDALGNRGVGLGFTTGPFLPRLRTLKYTGEMIWPWDTLAKVYLSHLQRPSGDLSYRPLALIKFVVTEFNENRHVVHSIGSEHMKKLGVANLTGNCHFEYALNGGSLSEILANLHI